MCVRAARAHVQTYSKSIHINKINSAARALYIHASIFPQTFMYTHNTKGFGFQIGGLGFQMWVSQRTCCRRQRARGARKKAGLFG